MGLVMEIRENIGELDTLVLVQSCTIGTGTRGQKTYVFTDHSRVWAKVDRTADEMVGNGNLEEGQRLQVVMYKIGDMTSRWRLMIDGKAYAITGIDQISRFSPLCRVSLSAVE